MPSFPFRIITPAGVAFDSDVDSVDVPATAGRMSVLAGHQPMVCALDKGTARVVSAKGTEEVWQLENGTLLVDRDRVSILVRQAHAVTGTAPTTTSP